MFRIKLTCRICGQKCETILDLGCSPPANSLLDAPDDQIEKYPLILEFCDNCKNVQLSECLSSKDLYKYYYYATPDSITLNKHYDYLTKFLINRDYLTSKSNVVEVGSNVGNYLKFIRPHVNTVLGVDPALNIAKIASGQGIKTIPEFFDTKLAKQIISSQGKANLIIARHCFAHNPSPHELLNAANMLLSNDGYLVIENAYVLNTLEHNEFDQIYHEHMFYYSIQSMSKALEMNGLCLQDIMISLIHGGSIVFVAKHISNKKKQSEALTKHLNHEISLLNKDLLFNFGDNAFKIKKELLSIINNISNNSVNDIYTYGATAKGNTLLNFLGLSKNNIKVCVDSTEIKQNKFLPGSNIKIVSEEYAKKHPPKYFLLTAWNYKDEIINKVRSSGNLDSIFIVPFPKPSFF